MSIYRMRTEFGHYLKPILGVIAVIFIIGGVWTFAPPPPKESSTRGGADVIANVNGEPITRGQYETLWQQWADQAREQGIRSPLQYANMRAMIFQRLVNNSMMVSTAKEMGVDVSDSKAEEQIDQALGQYLRQNRQAVLGKLNAEREAVDPKDDSEYKSQLSSMGSSIDQVEATFRQRISIQDVKAQIAQYGIQEKLRTQVKPVTEKEIADSYNTYGIRMIVLRLGSLPKAQVSTKAAKVQAEAAGGADFATLARENSEDPSKSKGAIVNYSIQTSSMFPPAVRDAIAGMSPGGISRAIETPVGFFIIKLESVSSAMPAKLDPKVREQRFGQLMQGRMAEAMLAYQQKNGAKQKVEVLDPEMLGYWQMSQASQTASSPAEYKKKIGMAIGSLKKALVTRGNSSASINLAELLYRDGQVGEAIRVLYPMLEGDNASVEGADLRMLLAEMMLKSGKKEDRDAAVKQYIEASEVARQDLPTHEQLATKFEQLGRADLAAKEQVLIADYKKQIEQFKAMKRPGRPGPAGAPGAPGSPGAPSPSGPPSGP